MQELDLRSHHCHRASAPPPSFPSATSGELALSLLARSSSCQRSARSVASAGGEAHAGRRQEVIRCGGLVDGEKTSCRGRRCCVGNDTVSQPAPVAYK
eukprot:377799-Hanusia_phi.AAC.1